MGGPLSLMLVSDFPWNRPTMKRGSPPCMKITILISAKITPLSITFPRLLSPQRRRGSARRRPLKRGLANAPQLHFINGGVYKVVPYNPAKMVDDHPKNWQDGMRWVHMINTHLAKLVYHWGNGWTVQAHISRLRWALDGLKYQLTSVGVICSGL